MLLNDVIYEDGYFWIRLEGDYFHVYEDMPCMGYAEHRVLTTSFERAKKWIEILKKEKEQKNGK